VPDQHHRGYSVRHGANTLEQLVGGGGVQLRLQPHRRRCAKNRPNQRLACPLSRGAEDQLRLDSEPDKVLGDPLRVPASSLRERPLVITKRRIRPAGFRVPKEVESVHRSGAPNWEEEVYERAGQPKRLHWIETSNHVELYDQAPFVPEAVDKLIEWFKAYMPAE